MNDRNYDPHPDYDGLSEVLKFLFSPKEYAWLDDESRRELEHDLTCPEPTED